MPGSVVGTLLIDLKANVAGLQRDMTRVKSTLDGAAAHAKTISRAVTGTLAGIGTAVVFREAVGSMVEFERTMSSVKAVTGATGEVFDEMAMKARRLGATTIFSAKEAAEGMKFLGLAGFTTNEILDSIAASLDLAVAGQLDLARTTDILSNILKQFNLAASESTKVADAMAVTATSANTNIEQLGIALSFAGPLAESLGISMETASAAIGALGNAGIQAERAGTGLRQILVKLAQDSPKLEKSLARVGLSMEDVDLSTRSFTEVLRVLQQLDPGATMDVFGDRGGIAALKLADLVDEVEDLEASILVGTGAIKEMAKIMQDNLFGSFKALISASQELILTLGEAGLGSALRTLVDFTTDAVRAFAGIREPLNRVAEGSKAAALALTPLIGLMGGTLVVAAAAGAKAVLAFAASLNAIPAVAIASALTAVGTALFLYRREITEISDQTAKWNREARENAEIVQDQLRTGARLVDLFESLSERMDLTRSEQLALNKAAEKLQDILPNSANVLSAFRRGVISAEEALTELDKGMRDLDKAARLSQIDAYRSDIAKLEQDNQRLRRAMGAVNDQLKIQNDIRNELLSAPQRIGGETEVESIARRFELDRVQTLIESLASDFRKFEDQTGRNNEAIDRFRQSIRDLLAPAASLGKAAEEAGEAVQEFTAHQADLRALQFEITLLSSGFSKAKQEALKAAFAVGLVDAALQTAAGGKQALEDLIAAFERLGQVEATQKALEDQSKWFDRIDEGVRGLVFQYNNLKRASSEVEQEANALAFSLGVIDENLRATWETADDLSRIRNLTREINKLRESTFNRELITVEVDPALTKIKDLEFELNLLSAGFDETKEASMRMARSMGLVNEQMQAFVDREHQFEQMVDLFTRIADQKHARELEAQAEVLRRLHNPVAAYTESLRNLEAVQEQVGGSSRSLAAALQEVQLMPEGVDTLTNAVLAAQERLRDGLRDNLLRTREWAAGVQVALSDYAEFATDAASRAAEALDANLQAVEDNLTTLVTEFKNAGELIKNVFRTISTEIQRFFVRNLVTGPLSKFLGQAFFGPGPLFNFAGGFAEGGTIPPNNFAVVGERGPEIVSTGNRPATVEPMMSGVQVNGPLAVFQVQDAQSIVKNRAMINQQMGFILQTLQADT